MTIYITPDEYSIAEANGISMKLVNNRVRERGWCKRRAITTPVGVYRGIDENDKWLKLALENDIPRYTYLRRIRDYGWDEQEAATRPVLQREEHIARLNVQRSAFTVEDYEIMEKNGIPRGVASNRVNTYGWSVQEAITTPVMNRIEATKYGNRRKKKNARK